MRTAGLKGRKVRRREPYDVGTRHTIAPNLLERQFAAPSPNLKWAADFTYLWTHEGLAVCRSGDRPVLATCGRPVQQCSHDHRAGDGCTDDGGVAPRIAACRAPSLGSGKPVRTQPVVATRCFFVERNTFVRASAGVCHSRLLRGLLLSARATASRSVTLCRLKSVPLGKYCRSSPLVVFVCASLPGTLWITEVNLQSGIGCEGVHADSSLRPGPMLATVAAAQGSR